MGVTGMHRHCVATSRKGTRSRGQQQGGLRRPHEQALVRRKIGPGPTYALSKADFVSLQAAWSIFGGSRAKATHPP